MSENTKMVAELAQTRPIQMRSSFRRSAQGREIVIVLGMHRSGTSLLANVLHLLGVDMVDEPPQGSASNEKGFWERADIRAVQDAILDVLGVPVGSTAHAVPFPAGWWRSLEIRSHKEQLRDLLASHLARIRRPWGFKDPRTCRLLPLWGEILEELDISPRFVWALRHPAESSLSMTMKNPVHRPIPVAQSEVMWLAYNYDILRHAGRHWPIIVPFDMWFNDPLAQAKELARELDLVWQGSDHELDSALAHIVAGELRHHRVGDGKLRSSLALSEDVYRSILGIRNGDAADVSEAAALSLHSLLGAVQPFALAAKDAKALKHENQRVREEAAAQVEEIRDECETLRAQLATARSVEEALHDDVLAAARKMDAFRSQIAAANAAREKAETAISALREELGSSLMAATGERDALQSEFAALRAKLESDLAAESAIRHSLGADLAAAGAGRDALQAELHSMRGHHEEEAALWKERLARLEDALAAATAARDGLHSELTALRAEEEDAAALQKEQAASLAHSLAAANAERDLVRAELAELRGAFDREGATSSERASQLAEEVSRLSTDVTSLRAKLRAERERHAEAFQALLMKTRPLAQASPEALRKDS
jgi:hypothetical protein